MIMIIGKREKSEHGAIIKAKKGKRINIPSWNLRIVSWKKSGVNQWHFLPSLVFVCTELCDKLSARQIHSDEQNDYITTTTNSISKILTETYLLLAYWYRNCVALSTLLSQPVSVYVGWTTWSWNVLYEVQPKSPSVNYSSVIGYQNLSDTIWVTECVMINDLFCTKTRHASPLIENIAELRSESDLRPEKKIWGFNGLLFSSILYPQLMYIISYAHQWAVSAMSLESFQRPISAHFVRFLIL